MPEKLDTTHQIIANELVVYRRPGSNVWQCRYKVDGVWLVRTTKKKELSDAIKAAYVLLASAQVRVEQNFSVATKKFKDVAKLALKAMEDKQEAGDGRVSYEQYARITNDFLIPFFGKRDVDSINAKALQEYAEYRAQKMGKEPAYSTVRKHNVALNRIFEEAVARGFMTTTQRPSLETKGRKAETFPTFTVEEVNVILASLPAWIERGRNEHKKDLRHLMACYVRVLIDTGARPGKELLELQWKNITYRVQFVDETVTVATQRVQGRIDYSGLLFAMHSLDCTEKRQATEETVYSSHAPNNPQPMYRSISAMLLAMDELEFPVLSSRSSASTCL